MTGRRTMALEARIFMYLASMAAKFRGVEIGRSRVEGTASQFTCEVGRWAGPANSQCRRRGAKCRGSLHVAAQLGAKPQVALEPVSLRHRRNPTNPRRPRNFARPVCRACYSSRLTWDEYDRFFSSLPLPSLPLPATGSVRTVVPDDPHSRQYS